MIQIQDLRIDNLVYRNAYNVDIGAYELIVCKVVGIKEKESVILHPNDTFRFGVEYNDLQPIPLTEQILLDSGFEPNGGNKISNHYRLEIEKGYFHVAIGSHEPIFAIAEQGDRIKVFPCHSTQHVHDLQNAYYMATGQELNIVIK